MEIHAPEKPILTIKEAAVHLLIVTVGILIALSLEGLVEYAHHRTVVREAREIMRVEIETNKKDLEQTMARIAQQRDGLVRGITTFSAMAAGDTPRAEGFQMVKYRLADLHTAGHSTAELMGAFAYMDYREVSRYAAVYDFQDRFVHAQDAALSEGIQAVAWRQQRNVLTTPLPELAVFTEKLRQDLAATILYEQFASQLHEHYEQFLGGK